MNLFKIIPNNFFSILASKNKYIYSEILHLIFEKTRTETSFSYYRKDLVSDIELILSTFNYKEATEEEKIDASKDKANEIIRKLVDTKWILESLDAKYNKTIMFTDIALPFINSIEEIISNTTLQTNFDTGKPKEEYTYSSNAEYDGYAFTIYSLITGDHNLTNSTVLNQVYDNINMLMSSLRQLNYKVKSYADNIEKLSTIDELVKGFFLEYTQEVLMKNYHKIKTLDNISKYRSQITGELSKYLKDNSYISEVAEQYIESGYSENIEDSLNKVRERLFYCIDSLQNIDDIIKQIDEENFLYTNLILKKTKFMVDNSDDVEGYLSIILKDVADNFKEYDKGESYLDDLIGIYSANYINNDSLYKPVKSKQKFKAERVALSGNENNENTQLLEKIRNYKHTRKSVELYVSELLEGKNFITLDEIPLNEVIDLIHLVYIVLYGSKSDVYKLEYIDESINVLGVNFKRFIVRSVDNG